MLYVGRGPSESHYRYVILDSPETKNMIDFEKFERPAIIHADATFNEVFGRPWNLLRLDSLPTLYEPRVPNNTPSRLFEDGTIATMHFEANEDEIAEMHANKLKKIKVSGRLTYIK
ncbi:hypothetical protein J3Q64DRAFT_1186909 [Phycomyces blakesleeanus]|uniref:Uncharacterized protein n=1 Tax=Phycomyces blakesleeanus TaxID=4837 RepID=A0ABR3ASS0_PHYBL